MTSCGIASIAVKDLVIGWGQRSRLVARSAMVTDEKVTLIVTQQQ